MKNKKFIFGFILGMLIMGTTVYAAYKYQASEVGYTPSNSNFNVDNVENAIEELYQKQVGPTYVILNTGETHKGIVYLDPTDLTKKCIASNSVSTTETKTGCMKWYVFIDDTNKNEYTMILDHNTTATTNWNSNNDNTDPSEINAEVLKLVSDYGWKITPRLITAQEIANIANVSWSGNTAYRLGTGTDVDFKNMTSEQQARHRSYHWVFDYTNSCTTYGCSVDDSATRGYFTSTPYSAEAGRVFLMTYAGRFDTGNAKMNGYGIRPVITISKSIIK